MWIRVMPIPSTSSCTSCGAPARRRFGGTLLTGLGASSPPPIPADTHRHSCAAHIGVPAACSLAPTAARTLAARVRGDNRALEAELAHQEAEIGAGRLDPRASVIAPYPGASAAGNPGGKVREPAVQEVALDKDRKEAKR